MRQAGPCIRSISRCASATGWPAPRSPLAGKWKTPARRSCCSASGRTRPSGARCCPAKLFEDYDFVFDHPVTLERHLLEGGLLSGQTEPRAGTANRAAAAATSCLPRTRWCFKHFDFTHLTLRSRRSGRSVRVRFDGFPYLGLWTQRARRAASCASSPGRALPAPCTGSRRAGRQRGHCCASKPGQQFRHFLQHHRCLTPP